MKAALLRWVAHLGHHIADRRDAGSCLLFVEMFLPFMLLLTGMQSLVVALPEALALYRVDWFWPSLWLQWGLIAWLALMGWIAWHRRHDDAPRPWLVQATVVPALLGVVLLSLAHGIKDSPMATVMLGYIICARALFSLWQLRWAFLFGLVALLVSEVYTTIGVLAYAPLLAAPMYDGHVMPAWWALWGRVIFSAGALPFSWLLFFVGATMQRRRQALEALARTDLLTGLANRREFMASMTREAHRQARNGRPLSIVMLDVDHFKRVNDSWGHPAGDEVLARLGHILRTHTRDQVDVAARYGGEEFALLLPETDLPGAQRVAEKIACKLREQAFMGGSEVFRVTLSAGVAEVVDGDTNWAVKVADRHLYEAKHAGRDRVLGSVAHPVGGAGAGLTPIGEGMP